MGWFGLFGGSSCNDEAATACAAVDPRALSMPGLLVSVSPFLATFGAISLLAHRHIFPRLSRVHDDARDGEDHYLPSHAPPSLRQAHAEHGARSARRRLAAAAFASTVGLAAVLGELILCETAELVDPAAKTLALRVVVPTLLLELVVLIPFLEIMSLVRGAGWSFQRSGRGKVSRWAWAVQMGLFAGWMFAFWSLGRAVPLDTRSSGLKKDEEVWWTDALTKACLERIGVIGISLMALLSGFASVSSPWHTLFAGGGAGKSRRRKPVTDAQISRKQAGLDATMEMLATKRHRLQALQRRAEEAAQQVSAAGSKTGFMGRMLGSLRGASGDEAEMKSLRLEISGLETMEANLSAGLAAMRGRQAADARAATTWGKVLAVPSYAFALYCLYRVAATTFTTLRRAAYAFPSTGRAATPASFAASDPISRVLGLLARHWDPKMDQVAWARQVSFLLSGAILALSASSVLQTFRLFARWLPGLLYQAQANLALLIGQIAATYVISAALLLRSSLPREVGSAVGDALQSALEPAFVDRWFEGWFLVAAAVTAAGIWIGRRLSGGAEAWEDWDDYAGEEMGQKRS